MYNETVRHIQTESLTNGRLFIYQDYQLIHKTNQVMKNLISNLFLGSVFDSWTTGDYKLVAAFMDNTSAN